MLTHAKAFFVRLQIYQHGGGLPWGELGSNLSSCTCCGTSATYSAALIPSLPAEITVRLKAGGSVADVGCGRGAAACLLGEHFPNALVRGFDYHAPSVDEATSTAARKGLHNVSFATGVCLDCALTTP